MSSVWYGIRGAFQARARLVAVVVILGLALGLALSMAIAKQAVDARVADVEETIGSTLLVTPAGTGGAHFAGGGGTDLSQGNLSFLHSNPNIVRVTYTLLERVEANQSSLKAAPGHGGEPGPALVAGTTDPSERAGPIGGAPKIVEGNAFNATGNASEAVLGRRVADRSDLGVGDTFQLFGRTIRVVGISEAGDQFSDEIAMIPLRTFQDLLDKPGAVGQALVQVRSVELVATTKAAIEDRVGDEADVTLQDEAARSATQPLAAIGRTAVFGLAAGIIAGAAILYFVMSLLVKERYQVIGLLKAIGATNARVVTQFVSEGLVLTFLAGLVGTGLGVLASGPILDALAENESNTPTAPTGHGPGFAVTNVEGLDAVIGPGTMVATVLVTIAVAILGCAVPAWRASRIRPAEIFRR